MGDVTTVFFDVGGVILTNGWDHRSRRAVVEHFRLDHEEFADRHDFVAHDFETGRLPLHDYLERTVFYRNRDFTEDEFFEQMQLQSRLLPGTIDVVDELREAGLLLATLNNESRELNDYRIESFGLRSRFSMFLSSCYLGVKKPEREIYDLALQVTQAPPERCLFIDDRDLNRECAIDAGLPAVAFQDAVQLRDELVERNVLGG